MAGDDYFEKLMGTTKSLSSTRSVGLAHIWMDWSTGFDSCVTLDSACVGVGVRQGFAGIGFLEADLSTSLELDGAGDQLTQRDEQFLHSGAVLFPNRSYPS